MSKTIAWCWLALVLLVLSVPASAQTVRGDRLMLNTGPCVVRSGAGSPEGAVTGSVCDTYLQTNGSTVAIWSKVSGAATNTGWQNLPGLGLANTWTAGGVFKRADVGDTAINVMTTVDTFPRLNLAASGILLFGSGALVGDTNLYRSAANVLKTDDDLVVALDLTVGSQIAVGDTVDGYHRHVFGGAFTSDGAGNTLYGQHFVGQLTGAAGDTSQILGSVFGNTFVTQTAAETIGLMAQAYFSAPTISKNVTAITNASTVYISGAPTAGDSNYALYIAGGGAYAAGSLTAVGAITAGANVGTADYASQTTGWRVTEPGAADFRYLFVDEMHAKSFIADLEMALAGGQIITKSVALVSQAFACPAYEAFATLWVRDLPSAADMAAFEAGDSVALRTFSRAAGSLTIADCVGVVADYVDGDGANAGQQSWVFTRNAAAGGGTMAATTTITVESLALDYGVTTNGYYEVNAIDGAYGVNSPYAQIVTWTTAPVAANRSVQARFGNLNGAYGYVAKTYGVAMGPSTATNITIDPTNGLRIRNGTTNKLTADTSGNLSIVGDLTVGTGGVIRSGATAYDTATGYWLDYNAGTPQLRIGTTTGAATPRYLRWTGADLELKSDSVTINNSGLSVLTAPSDSYDDNYAYRFYGLPAGHSSAMWHWTNGTTISEYMLNESVTTNTHASSIEITTSNAGVPYQAGIVIYSGNNANVPTISINASGSGGLVYMASPMAMTGNHTVGTATFPAGGLLWQDAEAANRTTTAAVYPAVSESGRLKLKTGMLNGTVACTGGQAISIVVEYGLVKSITCSGEPVEGGVK